MFFTMAKCLGGFIGCIVLVLILSLGWPMLKLSKAERDYNAAITDYRSTNEHANALEADFRTRYREYLNNKPNSNSPSFTPESADSKFREYDKMRAEADQKGKKAEELKGVRDQAKDRVDQKFKSLVSTFNPFE